MEIKTHPKNIAEVIADGIVVESAEDGLNLLGNLYFQGFDALILHQQNITPQFFDLKTGIAGEILQKFTNYRVRLAIVGSFEATGSKSLADFIFESNKLGQINFVATATEAIERLKG